MNNDMLIIDSVRYSRPDAYKAGLVDEDGNLLVTKQVPSSMAVCKDKGTVGETVIEADNPKEEAED